MRPILFSIGSLTFYSYGFFTALGFIAAGWAIHYLAKKKKLLTSRHREYFLIDALLLSLVVGIVAARLGYIVLYDLIFRIETIGTVSNVLADGFIFYAGLLAGLFAYSRWMHTEEKSTLAWLDALIVGVPVAMVFAEIGGYLNDAQPIHLAFVIGSAVLTAISYITYITEKKPGHTLYITLFLIFLLYFFLGFWRVEEVQWVGLGLSQFASLVGMLSIFGIYFRFIAPSSPANKKE